MLRNIIAIVFLMFLIHFKGNTQETDSFVISDEFTTSVCNETSADHQCGGCNNCEHDTGILALPFNEFPLIVVVLTIFVLLVVKKNRIKVLFWTLGPVFFAGLVLFAVQNQPAPENEKGINAADSLSPIPLTVLGNNPVNTSDMVELSDADDPDKLEGQGSDEDEFLTFNEPDELIDPDELNELTANHSFLDEQNKTELSRALLALFITILSGFAVRYTKLRKARYGILLASLIYFGFYSSGCPCMISSFQHFILFLLGEKTSWTSLLWFLGLIPVTYFLGKAWCGWVCHLGALQEFLYRPRKKNKLLHPSVQKGLKILQITALFVLIVQLTWTRTNLFIKIDPFKVAFNLFSSNITGYILLAILLVSSLLMYRPFCKGFCPVGLILGWTAKIPGASRLRISSGCKSCNQCLKDCSCQAINKKDGLFNIDNSGCIRCGDCMDTCKFGMICQDRL